jgi:hypothetical protein
MISQRIRVAVGGLIGIIEEISRENAPDGPVMELMKYLTVGESLDLVNHEQARQHLQTAYQQVTRQIDGLLDLARQRRSRQ